MAGLIRRTVVTAAGGRARWAAAAILRPTGRVATRRCLRRFTLPEQVRFRLVSFTPP